MNHKPSWWQLYLFTVVAFVLLFEITSRDTSGLILWMVIVYGGVAFWLRSNESGIAVQTHNVTKNRLPVVEEFFDEDRRLTHKNNAKITDACSHTNQRKVV